MNLKYLCFAFIAIGLTTLTTFAQKSASVNNLKCDYRVNPIGIDVQQPALSWQIVSPEKFWMQNSYEILVASNESILNQSKGDIWESGKVNSSESVHIKYSGDSLVSNTRYFWKVRVWDAKGKASDWSQAASWTTGLFKTSDWNATWISSRYVEAKQGYLQIPERGDPKLKFPANPDTAAVLMRKQFGINNLPVRATANICGLGYYELYMNDKKVGNHVLDPNFTNYTVRTNYVTYDITRFLIQGANTVGVILGNGFYNCPTPDFLQNEKSCWKTAPKLLLNITIEFSDGSKQLVVSDGSWNWSTGEIVFNCIRGGETIDNRYAQSGWKSNGFNDSGWKPVVEVPAPFGKLSAQSMPPIRVQETLQPIRIWEPKKGIYVFDFGKNITGWPKLKMKGKSGQTFVLQCNEVLLKDSTVDMEYSHANFSYGRFQTEVFILGSNNEEMFEPRFTYHGFRYVQISGLDSKPSKDCMMAESVNTDLETTGHFECSDLRINQLQQAVRHTLLNCIHGMPGEEPTREKMGYTQDAQNTMDAYVYNFDAVTSFIKYLRDMTDAQEPSGHVAAIAPTNGWGYLQRNGKPIYIDDPWWGASLAVIANKIYSYYGDKQILEEAYLPMKRYVDFLSTTAENNFITWSLGDWVDKDWKWPDGPGLTSVTYTSTAGYFYLAKLLSQNADFLGHEADRIKYSSLAEKIRLSFNQRFLNSETGTYERGSQTAQALALYVGLVPGELISKAEARLVDDIKLNDYHTSTGFIGVMPEMNYLGENSNAGIALKMISQEESPGWLFMVENETSTLGESLYKGSIGSGHHPFSACIGSWFYVYLGGIRPDPVVAGFKRIIIKPEIENELSWVKSSYESMYGTIKSDWKKVKNSLEMNIVIPENTVAEVFVPASDVNSVKENGKSVSGNQDVKFLRIQDNCVVFQIGSGSYSLKSEMRLK